MSIIEPNETEPPATIDQGVWPPPPANQPTPQVLQVIPDLRKQNVFFLILLYIGTLGFYTIFWMRRQILTINAIVGEQVISPFAVWVVVGLHVMAFGYGIVDGMMTLSKDSEMLMRLVFNVGLLIILFMIRTALNQAMRVREGDRGFIGKVATFFLSIFYMQYKINVYLKNRPSL